MAYAQDVYDTVGKTINPHLYWDCTLSSNSQQLYRLLNNSTKHIRIEQLQSASLIIVQNSVGGGMVTETGGCHTSLAEI